MESSSTAFSGGIDVPTMGTAAPAAPAAAEPPSPAAPRRAVRHRRIVLDKLELLVVDSTAAAAAAAGSSSLTRRHFDGESPRTPHGASVRQKSLGVDGRHAARAGGGDGLAVDVIGDVAAGEDARDLGGGRARLASAGSRCRPCRAAP